MGRLNLDDVRASAKHVKESKGGGKFFKCADGKNVVRLFTYESGPREKTALERPIRRHYKLDGANPLCQKTPAPDGRAVAECEYCDRVEEVRKDEGPAVAKRMEPSKKYVVNVVPVQVGGNPVQGPLKMVQFDMPTSVLEAVLAVLDDSGNPDAYVGLTGRDLAINYDSKADPKRMYTAMFRDETASAKTTAALKKGAAALEAAVVDFDSDPDLLPDWWIDEKGIKRKASSDDKPAAPRKAAAAPPPAADDSGDSPFEPDATEAPPEEPAEAPAAEPEDDDTDPAYERADELPKGVTAWYSQGKKKFFFKLPDGTTTFDEAAALAWTGGAAKPRPPAAAKPVAKKAAPAPAAAAKKKGK